MPSLTGSTRKSLFLGRERVGIRQRLAELTAALQLDRQLGRSGSTVRRTENSRTVAGSTRSASIDRPSPARP